MGNGNENKNKNVYFFINSIKKQNKGDIWKWALLLIFIHVIYLFILFKSEIVGPCLSYEIFLLFSDSINANDST